MLIKEEALRKIIREELLKENINYRSKIIQEGFLSDIAGNKALVLTVTLAALVSNIGKALADPASDSTVKYFSKATTKIEQVQQEVKKDKDLPDPLKKFLDDNCKDLKKDLDNFKNTNEKEKKLEDFAAKTPNNKKIKDKLEKIGKENNDALNKLIQTQEKCQAATKKAQKGIQDKIANDLIKKAEAELDYLEGN